MLTLWFWPPGTIVICIDASPCPNPRRRQSAQLVKGAYYTIRHAGERMHGATPVSGVLLNEIVCNSSLTNLEYGFLARRFKPAESTHCERETTRAQQPQKVTP